VGNWTPAFRDHYFASKYQEQFTQGGGVISEKKRRPVFKYDKMDKTRKIEMSYTLFVEITYVFEFRRHHASCPI
jgi:hypothetical protein